MTNPDIRIKHKTYTELMAYLETKASSELQAKSLVEQLKTQARPYYQLDNGAYLIDGHDRPEYRIK